LFDEGPQGSTHWPRLLLLETAAAGFFAAIPALAVFLLTGAEIANPLLIAAYLSAPAFFIWIVVECIRFYIFLNQQPRRRSFASGLAAAVVRILGALVIWIYLGLAASIESILWLFWVGAGLIILGLFLNMGHYFAARKEQFKEKIKPDLLTSLAGVDSEVQCVLWQAEIYTYQDLARADKRDLTNILSTAARPYLSDPSTWPYQARLARDEAWNELETFKSNLQQWQPVNDLTRIAGVDRRIQEIFWANGLFTFRQVAAMSTADLKDRVARAGIVDGAEYMDTWPLQAQLLQGGKPEAVNSLRRQLRQNREVQDLTVIEGVDNEIQRRLQTAGIFNFHQISELSAADLVNILAEFGPVGQQADPRTWPYQARLAVEDDWEALEELKLNLKGGKPMDDLTQINGINPAIQTELQQAGILTYLTLAETDVDRLVSILAEKKTAYRLSNLISSRELGV
jgi:predicted flap endonuclease-1-like 5' DNA nuclease